VRQPLTSDPGATSLTAASSTETLDRRAASILGRFVERHHTLRVILEIAEAANPGVFIGKPIVVEMTMGNAFATAPSATATVRARLQKR